MLSFQRALQRAVNVPTNAGDQPQRQGFHSNHEGGVHFLMADGAVRFVSENIEHTATTYAAYSANPPAYLGLYQRLGCRNCGLTRGDF